MARLQLNATESKGSPLYFQTSSGCETFFLNICNSSFNFVKNDVHMLRFSAAYDLSTHINCTLAVQLCVHATIWLCRTWKLLPSVWKTICWNRKARFFLSCSAYCITLRQSHVFWVGQKWTQSILETLTGLYANKDIFCSLKTDVAFCLCSQKEWYF